MIKRKFVCAMHDEYGEKGWKPTWLPGADPLWGMAIPHDVLEHGAKDDGGAEAEFRAIGAILWLRGETGFMQRNGNVNSAEKHLSSEIPQIMGRVVRGDQRLTDPGRTTRLEEWTEETLQGVRRELRTSLAEDIENYIDRPIRDVELDRIVGWMRKGYRGAIKRFKGCDPRQLAYGPFLYLEEAADRLLKVAEEGYELHVTVDAGRYSARAKLVCPYDDYEY